MPAINEYYASNAGRAINTIQFNHPAFNAEGVLRLAQSSNPVTAAGDVYDAAAIDIQIPSRNTEGTQQVNIGLSNVKNSVWLELVKVVNWNIVNDVPMTLDIKQFMASDLNSVASFFSFQVNTVSVSAQTATVTASYSQIYNTYYPRKRYYPSEYPGLKYT